MTEGVNLGTGPESNLIERKKKYSGIIKRFLESHPSGVFTENNSLTSVVEAETDYAYSSRQFGRYEDSYISRLIEEATSVEEQVSREEGRHGLIVETPFYIYESERATQDLARLTQYKKAFIIIKSKTDGLEVYASGVKETSSYAPADRIYGYNFARQILKSEMPLEALKDLEKQEKSRNSMLACSREVMSALAKAYNEFLNEELALTEKIEKIRAAVQGFPSQTLISEILVVIPHEVRSLAFSLKDFSIEECLKELVKKVIAMDTHRFDFHRAMEYFGYKFGGGMNKREIDKAILIDRCPDRLESKDGRVIGIKKNPTGIYYLFGIDADYDYKGGGNDIKDKELIKRICEEINAKFNKTIASLDDAQGGSTHTYWRQIGLFIENAPGDEESLDQINEIIKKHIDL
ncbi:MAG: hypothetical protein M3M85_00740 [bacterium]|nr:hypothetical protein [bacterium]